MESLTIVAGRLFFFTVRFPVAAIEKPPPGWQGLSLFAAERPERVYLFTGFHHYLFGLVERDRKYVYDVTTDRSELYDLKSDPEERRNLFRSVADRSAFDQSQRRLAGWLHFQNKYLSERFPPRHAPAAE